MRSSSFYKSSLKTIKSTISLHSVNCDAFYVQNLLPELFFKIPMNRNDGVWGKELDSYVNKAAILNHFPFFRGSYKRVTLFRGKPLEIKGVTLW